MSCKRAIRRVPSLSPTCTLPMPMRAMWRRVFAAQEGQLYSKVQMRVLTNKEATAAAIKDGLEWIKSQTTSRDVGVIFLSGHGENDNEGRFLFRGARLRPEASF